MPGNREYTKEELKDLRKKGRKLLGKGAAGRAADKLTGRRRRIDEELKKAGG